MTGEGTVLLHASRLPGSTPKHMTVRKNDSVPRAETGGVSLPAFLLNCKADDSEGTELCQGHHGCRGQRRSRDSPEERYKTASRKTGHVPTSLFNPAADDRRRNRTLPGASRLPGSTPQQRQSGRTIQNRQPKNGSSSHVPVQSRSR